MLNDNISMAMFVFSRAFKNIRVFSDTCKLTNSELLYYSKDSPEELDRFYYELYELINADYFIDARIEFMISSGWYYTAVYGNLYRLKEFISFKFCHLDRSKRVCAVFLPQDGFNPMPYFSMQTVTNYILNRKHYMAVNTLVMPFTSKLDLLFDNLNYAVTAATIFRTYMSSLRLEDVAGCRTKYVKQVANIWKSGHEYYKGVRVGVCRSCPWSLGTCCSPSWGSSRTTTAKWTSSTIISPSTASSTSETSFRGQATPTSTQYSIPTSST